MEFLQKFFRVQEEERSNIQIFLWWELRRIPFNIIVLIATFVCLEILHIDIIKMEMGDGEYFIFLIFIFLILLFNLAFTLAWIIELVTKRSQLYAPKVLKRGIAVSLFCLTAVVTMILFILN